MSDWGSEYESATYLCDVESKRLLALDPDHELLKYWIPKPEEFVDGKLDPVKEAALQLDMKNRFWKWEKDETWVGKAGIIVSTVVMTNYFLALKKAADTIEGRVTPEPPPAPPTPTTPLHHLDDESDIPF